MQIVNKNIYKLIPYENNPRINDEAVEYVKNSIKEFGFKVPIIIDTNNVIIAGHTRYKASEELGLIEVPCIVADDLTDEQVKAYRLADNKVSENSYWNYEKLDKELADIIDIDMSLFDFSPDDLDIEIPEDKEDDEKSTNEKSKEKHVCPGCGLEFYE